MTLKQNENYNLIDKYPADRAQIGDFFSTFIFYLI